MSSVFNFDIGFLLEKVMEEEMKSRNDFELNGTEVYELPFNPLIALFSQFKYDNNKLDNNNKSDNNNPSYNIFGKNFHFWEINWNLDSNSNNNNNKNNHVNDNDSNSGAESIASIAVSPPKRGKLSNGLRFPKTQLECAFCKNNKETPEMYKSHVLKSPEGKISCPVLRQYDCPICHNGGGDYAHTVRYCPMNKAGQVSPSIMKALKNGRSSDGKKRFK